MISRARQRKSWNLLLISWVTMETISPWDCLLTWKDSLLIMPSKSVSCFACHFNEEVNGSFTRTGSQFDTSLLYRRAIALSSVQTNPESWILNPDSWSLPFLSSREKFEAETGKLSLCSSFRLNWILLWSHVKFHICIPQNKLQN